MPVAPQAPLATATGQAVGGRGDQAVRNGAIDSLRLAAAAVIVLFHAGVVVGPLMPAAMGFFTVLVAYFSLRSDDAPMGAGVRRRADRLLRPFVIWASLAAAMKVADAIHNGAPPLSELTEWVPPLGSFNQLWFLPFAFVVGLLAPRRPATASPLPISLFSGLLVLAAAWLMILDQINPPNGIYTFLIYTPSALLGFGLGYVDNTPATARAVGILCVLTGFSLWAMGVPGHAQLWAGVPAMLLAFHLPWRGSHLTRLAADLSLGVYLVHAALIAVLAHVLPGGAAFPAFGVLALAGSMTLAAAIRATGLGRLVF